MTTTAMLFADAQQALLREVTAGLGHICSDDAFVSWLLPNHTHLPRLASLALAATARLQTERHYQPIAVIGFAAHAGVISDDTREILASGLLWLVGRSPLVDGNPMAFCTDAVALFGIALGAQSLGEQSVIIVAQWMSQFLCGSYNMMRIHDWQRCLFAAAQNMVQASPQLTMPDTTSVADIRVAFYSKSLLPLPDTLTTEQDEEHALSLLKIENPQGFELPRAALRIAAYDWIRRSAPVIIPNRSTVQDISNLLGRVSSGLRQWTWEDKPRTRRSEARKWHIDNEYHVQNLLYFFLSPIFPDLKNEEHFPSIGQKQPRPDLYIPSLKLIIEVKFIYPATSFQKIIGEIGEDASLYLIKGSNYTGIIAFVWDDTRRTEQHSLLTSGLKTINGIVDAIVVSRPGVMENVEESPVGQTN